MAVPDLDAIRAHPNYPFADFETDPLSFLMLELYWAQLFADAMGEAAAGWAPLETASEDGSPILSVASVEQGRGCRVIQKPVRTGVPAYPAARGEGVHYPFQAWMNAGFTPDGATPLSELVIFADVSDEAEAQARKLIALHCAALAPAAEVEAAIAAYEDAAGMPD